MKLLLLCTILFGLGLAAPNGNREISERSGSIIFIPNSPGQLIEFFQYLNAGANSDEYSGELSTFTDIETDEDIPNQEKLTQDEPDLYSNGLVQTRAKRSAKPEPFFLLARLFGFRRARRFRRRRYFG